MPTGCRNGSCDDINNGSGAMKFWVARILLPQMPLRLEPSSELNLIGLMLVCAVIGGRSL